MPRITQSELEAIADQILAEYRIKGKAAGREKALLAWRSKLQKEPTSLAPFQIDQIMRMVQARLTASS